jgi:catechol-2,3-dioxygenase
MAAQPKSVSSEAQRIAPAKFAHAVLRTTRFKEMIDWYRTVLNAKIAYENNFLAFMTYDDEHHRIAIAAFPGISERQPHSAGLDHLAYTYASLGDLVATYERLKVAGITPVVTINHGITTSMYYRDPDGGKVELQIDNYDDAQAMHDFMRSAAFEKNPIGVDFDPDELARGYHEGRSQAELIKYDEAKGFNGASLARLGE